MFFCQQCGECCSHMSRIFTVEEDPQDGTYAMHNAYTGEIDHVRVDPEKIGLFKDREIFRSLPEACFFLRRDPENGLFICTVHGTRPELCREFSCWRLLVLTERGERAGRVMGSRHLASEERALSELWESRIRALPLLDDPSWDREVIRILEGYGYKVITDRAP
ncbi:MAG: YkgJ family cysteine cluster protein [Methanomicrobiales archaeon]|nr:YkgJ family cysteine cluster protein [Methanomicrobiales archaeon]